MTVIQRHWSVVDVHSRLEVSELPSGMVRVTVSSRNADGVIRAIWLTKEQFCALVGLVDVIEWAPEAQSVPEPQARPTTGIGLERVTNEALGLCGTPEEET